MLSPELVISWCMWIWPSAHRMLGLFIHQMVRDLPDSVFSKFVAAAFRSGCSKKNSCKSNRSAIINGILPHTSDWQKHGTTTRFHREFSLKIY